MAGVPITNDAQLIALFSAEMTAIVDEFSGQILEIIKESVRNTVYSETRGDYERLEDNGGFLGAWGKEVAKFAGKYVESLVGIDPLGLLRLQEATAMKYVPEKHQHGNSAGDDRRANMAEFIATGTGYDFGGNAAMPRDFWSIIEQKVNDGSFDAILESLFSKHGIQFTKTF